MNTNKIIIKYFTEFNKEDRKTIAYLLYYSIIEAILLLVTPLTSAFIINSVFAAAEISIIVLSIIVILVFGLIVLLQILNLYILEKFQQNIFINNSIQISLLAIANKENLDNKNIAKYMNYFFDVISIQKLLPSLFMNFTSMIIKFIVASIVLFLFDVRLFGMLFFMTIIFTFIIYLLGKDAPQKAIERSNAKHEAIHYIQSIPFKAEDNESVLTGLDNLLIKFIDARKKMFRIVIRQLSLSFFVEGIILSTFFIVGAYLVFEGYMPIGEFVAAEIIIISLAYSVKDFVKQLDYVYDLIEGFYKIDKLANNLGQE